MASESARSLLAKFDKDKRSRSLGDPRKEYIKPHIESGYRFTSSDVTKHSDKYWKHRAGQQSRKIKCSSDLISKVKFSYEAKAVRMWQMT